MKFIELNITSNFTFLTGGSHPEEYANRVASIGMEAFAITDVNSVAGIVRAHKECLKIALSRKDSQTKNYKCSPRLIPATKLVLNNGFCLNALAPTKLAWSEMSRIISKGRQSAPKGQCNINTRDLLEFGSNLILLIHPSEEAQKNETSPDYWLNS